MKTLKTTLGLLTALALAGLGGCSSHTGDGHESEHLSEGREAHERDTHEGGGEEGEEDGTELAIGETYDAVRGGARLVLAYDPVQAAFRGTVSNTTTKTLERVRVEVHLSNGTELGPTVAASLAPGESREVQLSAKDMRFERWNAHPETGSGEHGGEHGGEGSGEHGREGGGEHDG